MDTVNILIKPCSFCNLRCSYCFYADLSPRHSLRGSGLMSHHTLDTLVREAFSQNASHVSFAFQGGEPTLAGIDFFHFFSRLLLDYRPPDVSVALSIQTNGITINKDWADYFRSNAFLVGLSIDGPADLHNLHRSFPDGKASFTQVFRAYDTLINNGVDVNILSVVTAHSARKAQSLYRSFKKHDCRFLQFIPCLEPLDSPRGLKDYALTPDKYALFLKSLFDLWFEDWANHDYVSIRLFDDYVRALAGLPVGSCASTGNCGRYFVVESDGAVYPCDFYTTDDWFLGSINDLPLRLIADKAASFLSLSQQLPPSCFNCDFFHICRGGCRRDRFLTDSGFLNYYCSAFKDFFTYSLDRLAHIARLEQRAIPSAGTAL